MFRRSMPSGGYHPCHTTSGVLVDRERAKLTVIVAVIVAVVAGVGAAGFFSWHSNRSRVAESTAGFTEALTGRAAVADVPPIWPGWLLVGVAVVAVLVAVGVGVGLAVASKDPA